MYAPQDSMATFYYKVICKCILYFIILCGRYYFRITTDRNYQLLELPIRLVGIPNWLEILIRIARNYQHSELPIFGIFNRNTECEPVYGLRYGFGYGLGYGLGNGLGYGLGNGLGCGLGYGLGCDLWHELGCGLRYGLDMV